jgi:hypothetical protein
MTHSYEVQIYGEDGSIEIRYDDLDSVEELIEIVMDSDDKHAPDVKVIRKNAPRVGEEEP